MLYCYPIPYYEFYLTIKNYNPSDVSQPGPNGSNIKVDLKNEIRIKENIWIAVDSVKPLKPGKYQSKIFENKFLYSLTIWKK